MTDDEMPKPTPFLEVIVHAPEAVPAHTGLCAGFEEGTWRTRQFARHAMKWLPEFALKHRDYIAISGDTAVESLRKAAAQVYKDDRYGKRGEFGELLLHIAIRQVSSTIPAVSKIYYKDNANDVAKGFDAVHVVPNEDELELWLGEAKFYQDPGSAVRAAVESLVEHEDLEFLRGEFVAITNKLDPGWPHADRLAKLLSEETSLDDIFDVVVVPVLLTYNSETVQGAAKCSDDFHEALATELGKVRNTFAKHGAKHRWRVHLFIVPVEDKEALRAALHEELVRMK